MNKTFLKNLFRSIRKTFSRFLSIVIIIAVGVAFYAGVRATSPDMKMSADYYFNKTNLMDFKLISTLGLTGDNIKEMKKVKGIIEAEGAKSVDAVTEIEKHALVLNVDSMPKAGGMNELTLVSGRKPLKDKEAIVEDKFLKENKLKLGDTLVLKSGNDTDLKDTIKDDEFKIVGTAKSPLYVSAQRQLSSVGNGSVRGFVYILPEEFKNDVYTEIYVKTDKGDSKKSLTYNDDYKKANDGIETALKNLGKKINNSRYTEVFNTANDKIKDAENKLQSAEKEAADKFKAADDKLQAAKDDIAKGENELEQNEILFNQKMSQGEKQIEDGKANLLAGQNTINEKLKEIEDGREKLAEAEAQINQNENNFRIQKSSTAQSIAAAVKAQVEDAKSKLDADPTNAAYIAQYNALNNIYESDINGKSFDDMYSSLKGDGSITVISSYFNIEEIKGKFDAGEAQLQSARQQLSISENSLNEGSTQLQAAIADINENKEKLSQAEAQLNSGRQDGIAKLASAKAQIEDGQSQIEENTKKLNDEKEKANTKFNDAEKEIQKNKDKINDIKKPDFYVLGRSQNVGYENYRQDSNRIDNIGKAFPFIFFLVAALVSLTTMTRMVQENRIEIGTFKALGYSRRAIIGHYLIYSLAASLLGSLIGISLGFRIFPPLIMNAYGSLYTIPTAMAPFNTVLAVEASLIAIFFTTVAAVLATMEELREVPASLMRPKPPKAGKVILLERITFIWKRLKFTRKVTARNIFRYKQRLFMTVVGIAACTGLMITGFGLKEGISGAVESQYNSIYKYDIQTSLTKAVDTERKAQIKASVEKLSDVKSILFDYSKNASVKEKNSSNVDVYIVVPEKKGELNKYIDLSKNGKELSLSDDGVIITEKLSKLSGKKIGDTIDITVDNRIMKAKISDITEHYIQHYIYMSPKYYEKISGDKFEANDFYGLLKNTSDSVQDKISKSFNKINGIGSVSFKNNTKYDSNKSMKSINSVVFILIASAGVLAFVVIYNLTNININERKRELATIKLLGFYNNELAFYIYRENIILTVIGSLFGIVLGILIDNFVVVTAETEVMMFRRTINPIYFLYSVLLTILFSVVVNLAMYKRFDKIDMVESLKSAE